MIKAGVIGHPISHSLSPRLHTYWLKQYKIDGEYNAYDVAPEQLEGFISLLRDNGMAGCNVTIPHKEAVMPLLDEIDPGAADIGAVNTIVVKNGRLIGSNTDITGFAQSIKPRITGTKKAVLLGAGGAAKAIVPALKNLGFVHIMITNRTAQKAEELAHHYNVDAFDWDIAETALQHADLLVNATSLGLKDNAPLTLSLDQLPKTALVTDIVYKPLITPLLAAAQARGNPVVDGLGMLLHQAVPGFEAWFGVHPEVTAELREHVLS